MRTFLEQKNRFGKLTRNSTAANLTYGGELINDKTREILYGFNWYFIEKQATDTSVASQQNYAYSGFASDVGKVVAVQFQDGDNNYDLIEITNWEDWNLLNQVEYTSDTPTYYFLFDEEVLLYPTPSTNGDTITLTYKSEPVDQSADDDESPMPFGYEMLPVYLSAEDYFLGQEDKQGLGDRMANKAALLLKKMEANYGSASTGVRLDTMPGQFKNPNDYPQNMS